MLVAIAIPIFNKQLEKSREATDQANLRSAYAELVTAYLDDSSAHTVTVPVNLNSASSRKSNDFLAGELDFSNDPAA